MQSGRKALTNLDTNEPDELELLDKLLDEKYQQTVDTKTKNDKAS